jgi:hypothetical protein
VITEKNEDEKNPLEKPDTLSPDQVRQWLSRAKIAHKHFVRALLPKYNAAKRRYNSEINVSITAKNSLSKSRSSHTDINLLFKDIRDFVASIFHKNPQIDLSARNDRDEEQVWNIENLQQKVNDDIKDNEELKWLLRSTLIDENLASVGAIYQDYYYQHEELEEVIEGTSDPKLNILENEVKYCKILPENLIVPPWVKQYNYKSGPYLGYVDIVMLDDLKDDLSLDQSQVLKLKGSDYQQLNNYEGESGQSGERPSDDVKHVKCYYLFIKGSKKTPMKRLVIAGEGSGVLLSYGDWDKGHKGYPIHILMLNDADSDSFLPPSEAWLLERILMVVDYIFEKVYKHVRKSSTKLFVKEGAGGINKNHIDKLLRNVDQEIIGLADLPPGTDIRSLILPHVDALLSADHSALLDLSMKMFDALSRQPSFAKATVLNKKMTATESEKVDAEDNSENSDYIDKFRDFLISLFGDHARLVQRNFQGKLDLSVMNEDAGDKELRQEVTMEQFQGDFKEDITLESFSPPNSELKKRTIKEALVDLMKFKPLLDESKMQINAKKFVEEYLENIRVRDPRNLIIPKPVRNIDQQVTDFVFKSIPFNPDELGQDFKTAYDRLSQIFQDDQMMASYEQLNPAIYGEQSPLIDMLRILSERVNGEQNTKQSKTTAKTEVGLQAAEMGQAQNV